MLYAEIQSKMSGVFEQLKTLEVKIQATQADVEQSLKQDQTCKEGLEEVQKRIDECKAGDVVFMKKYVAARKDFDTVRDFSEQSRAHTTILQSALGVLEKSKKLLQAQYDQLGEELKKAGNNLVPVVFGK